MQAKSLYKRVIVQLSGEALLGDTDFGIDPLVLTRLTEKCSALSSWVWKLVL